jgi:phenylacetic acid degradation protein
VHPTAFVHPSAVLIGDVIIGAHCYVGPAACLRGDFGRIEMEDGANVQDACVMQSYADNDAVIERYGHIGHGAISHGCRISENALVGTPARVLRQLTDEEVAGKTRETEEYIALARRSLDTMREVEALAASEPGRRIRAGPREA